MSNFPTHAALRAKYCAPEWAILFEVGNATGFKTNRHADAIAMSLWPSRGLALHGFEIKASRSDWIKELKDPAKAEAIAAYCDFWWLVVGDKEIVKPSELPLSWGLLAPKGDKLVVAKEPTQNATPKVIDRAFLAAMFRRCHAESVLPEAEIRRAAHEEGYKLGKQQLGYRQEELQRDFSRLQSSVTEFERKSGVQIGAYNGAHIGEQFLRVFHPPEACSTQLEHMLRQAKAVTRTLQSALANPPQEICEYII